VPSISLDQWRTVRSSELDEIARAHAAVGGAARGRRYATQPKTYSRLRTVCELHFAEVYAKVRLADVLPIEGSGLSEAIYGFSLQSHYDFVVRGRDQAPLPFRAAGEYNALHAKTLQRKIGK
jgi:hypothetical protein